MKHRWELDRRYPDDVDLEVQREGGDWHIIAFIRWIKTDKHYKCLFMDMEDGKFPDGEIFKTKRGAKNFCERHMPVIWIRHNANTGDNS